MKSSNRKWQNHLKSKGIIPFMLDRLKSHALSSVWQYEQSPFFFPIEDREADDELSKAFFHMVEEFPYEFYIELTNKCNLNCRMCARQVMRRSEGVMDTSLFERLIAEIADEQPYAYIHYYGIGESLLDPDLFRKLEFARTKGITNSVLFTNGQLLLSNDNYKRLADAGLSSIGIDLDGFTPDIYSKIRVGGDFFLVKRAIENLHCYIRASRIKTRVELAYHLYPGCNEADLPPFVAWCDDNAYEFKLVTMHSWAGLRSDIGKTAMPGLIDDHFSQRKNPCANLWSGFFIAWDGRVATCFNDAALRETMGEVNTHSIKSVWAGDYLRKRWEHVNGIFRGVCAGCTSHTNIVTPPFRSAIYPDRLFEAQNGLQRSVSYELESY